jgi:hypothetical protein
MERETVTSDYERDTKNHVNKAFSGSNRPEATSRHD